MASIHITDIEAAINWWRERQPSPDGITACREVRALAEVYALMVYYHEDDCDERTMPAAAGAAWHAWYASTPDAPCIAICSTTQGDPVCKGCGRTFDEVQRWPQMTPTEKRVTWRRITHEATAWRFNRYAERAAEGGAMASAPEQPLAQIPAVPTAPGREATAPDVRGLDAPEPGAAASGSPAGPRASPADDLRSA